LGQAERSDVINKGAIMKQSGRVYVVLLLAMITLGTAAQAQERRQKGDALDTMIQEGWRVVAPGVLQRKGDGNKVETFAVGAEGQRWALKELRSRLAFLRKEYRSYRTDQIRQAIAAYQRQISKIQRDLARAKDGQSLESALAKLGCDVSYGSHASAAHLSTTQGVTATASAHFENDCGYSAETFASAYARADRNGATATLSWSDPRTGSVISSSATASVEGTANCHAEAYSFARYTLANIFLSFTDTHSDCPVVKISSPFSYGSADDQHQACLGLSTGISSHCATITHLNDRLMCESLSGGVQTPCAQITDHDLQLACYGMATRSSSSPSPSNCDDITDAGLQSFCRAVTSSSASYCYDIADNDTALLCLAMAGNAPSLCASISNPNDRSFCSGLTYKTSAYCDSIH
jgi:ribosomal protein L29